MPFLVVLGNTAIAGICTLIELCALFFNIVASVMAAFTRNENSFIRGNVWSIFQCSNAWYCPLFY